MSVSNLEWKIADADAHCDGTSRYGGLPNLSLGQRIKLYTIDKSVDGISAMKRTYHVKGLELTVIDEAAIERYTEYGKVFSVTYTLEVTNVE